MTSVLGQGQALGEFEILEVAGIGGMGVVYRARQRSLDRTVALKVIRDEVAQTAEYRERFMREAHLAASVDHPNIVSVFEVGDFDGRLALAMQWVQGENLRDVLRASHGLPPERAVPVLAQLGAALDAIHGMAGLVHRDIKPGNVLIRNVGGNDHAYLTDFGVAKRSDTVADLTATGMVVGTVDYMAPEQITGLPADARTDVYALGCVFYEMLSGRVPYERENSVAKLFAHVSDPPPRLQGPLAERYPAFAAVLEKAMAKNPGDRYVSAGDFAHDASAALHGMRYTGPPSVVAVGDAKPAPTNPVLSGAGPTAADPAQLETLRQALTARQPDTRPVQPQPPAAPTAPASLPAVVGPPTPLPPPTPQPQPAYYPYYGQQPPPPTQSPPARRGSPLVLILLAAVAAAGVAVGVLAALGIFNPKSTPTHTPSAHVVNKHHSGGTNNGSSVAPAPTTGAGYPVGPCDQNISVNQVTSCPFADNVFRAYVQAYRSNGDAVNEIVSAYSPVTGNEYGMTCTTATGRVTCTNAGGSFVTFPLHAAQVY